MKTPHPPAQPIGQTQANNGKPRELPTRARGHRVTLADVEAIAELCAERLNERESCARLGIPYKTWMNWKTRHRNNQCYDEVLTRIRANKLAANLQNIQQAAKGDGKHQRADWRASSWLLEHALATDGRFSDRVIVEQGDRVQTYNIPGMEPFHMVKSEYDAICDKALKNVQKRFDARDKAKAIDIPSQAKQLPETTGSDTTQKETP